ncbi:protein TALPID3 isoform X2 [Stegostoma tigrinum]|uniref:protein TALPID3 isoform X2 n=1 Tax=Stegostoma tigrinum TaxID=3053191 RepID=UPI00202B1DA3|nr:protein TALPID3 isoform X2 [Stegostoma tigrinum]
MEVPVNVAAGGSAWQPGTASRVRISVQKLREVTSPSAAEEPVYIPPALLVNKPWGNKNTSDGNVSGGTSADEYDLRTKSSVQQTQGESNHTLQTWHSSSNHQQVIAGHVPTEPGDGSRHEGNDVLISRYTKGQKEAKKAIVKSKMQKSPIGKKVKVQLLHKSSVTDLDSFTRDEKEIHHHFNSVTTTAAATAAAVVATAPLLKAQSDLDAKLSTVVDLGTKLQEMDQQMKQVVEHQVKARAQDSGSKEQQERVRELETQLNTFLNQRLCHLEKFQEQQLELQSRILTSAFTMSNIHPVDAAPTRSDNVTLSSAAHCNQSVNQGLQQLPSNNIHYVSHGDVPSDSSATLLACRSHPVSNGFDMGGSLQTPAPRQFAPVPMSKDVQVQQKKAKSAIQKAKVDAVISLGRQGNRNFFEELLNNQETPASAIDTVEKTSVAMTTAGRHPDRSSCGNPLTESFTAFVAPSMGSGSAASKVSPAVQKATDVLRDLGRLKREMHGILQEAEHWQSQLQGIESAKQSNSHKSIGSASLQHHLLKQPTCIGRQINTNHSQKPSLLQSVKVPKSMFEDAERILREVQTNKKFIEENLQAIVRAKDSASVYSLIDSLDADSSAAEKIRIGKTVDAWIAIINQDIQDEIAKTNFLQKVSSNQQKREQSLMSKGGDVKAIKFNENVKDKSQNEPEPTTKRSLSTERSLQKQRKEPCGSKNLKSKAVMPSSLQKKYGSKISANLDGITLSDPVSQSEDYLGRVYGKAVYQGHRRTYKKGPYLKLNSPIPKSKPQRPKVIESIKGVKMKSTRTQTASSTLEKAITTQGREQQISVPDFQSSQYLFSPSHQIPSTSPISGPIEGQLVPMAVALGEPRIDDRVPQAADLIISSAPSVIPISAPSSPPKQELQGKKSNIAVVHMKSEKRDPVKLTVQVLPNVDIDSLPSTSPVLSQRSSSPEQQQALPHPVQTVIQSQEAVQSEEGDITDFPGTSYVAVADLPKDPGTDIELQGLPEPGIRLEGFAESISVTYNGPPFPPSVPARQEAIDIVDRMIKSQESIENQLVEWVEQEVMSHIISEMYPLQHQPVSHISQPEDEENASLGSDVVELVGGGDLQLFVDAGIPVNTQIVRQFVDEALAEIIAIMLGQHQSESRTPIQEVAPRETPSPTMLIPTPDPTPRHTPSPPVQHLSLIQTPDVTPQDSVAVSEERESEPEPELEPLQKSSPVLDAAGLKSPGKSSPIGTPVATPFSTPSRVSTPSPVAETISGKIKNANILPSQRFPNPWGDVELPLEEENPSSIQETTRQARAIVMSVAKDEDPESLALPLHAVTPIIPAPSLPDVQIPTAPVQSLTPLLSTEGSSSTISITETETADRNISEGEILINYRQMAAAKALIEEGIYFPNFNVSLSSTLQDAREMDEDPPSEGQVISKTHKGLQKYSLGTMLAQVSQGPYAPQEVHHPEDSDDDSSAGQVSEGQMPRFTGAAESIMTGQSQYRSSRSMNRGSSLSRRGRSPSPGQFDIHKEGNGWELDASYGPMTLADLETCPIPALPNSQAFQKTPKARDKGQDDDIPALEQKPATARVIKVESRTPDATQQSTKADKSSELQATPLKMSVTLPSMNEEEQSGSISAINDDDDDDDTSGAEIF